MNKIILPFALLILIIGCERDPLDEETLKAAQKNAGNNAAYSPGNMNLVCSGTGGKPAQKVHCFTVGNATAPHYYGDAELTGKWINSNADVDMTLNSDGSGTWHWVPTFGSPKTSNIRWGVLVNKDGTKPGAPSGWYVNVVEYDYGDLIDGQFGASVYYPSSRTWSNGWTR